MPRNSEDFWREQIASWEVSGKQVRQYCKTNQLNVSTFYKWKKRLFHHLPKNGKSESIYKRKELPQEKASFLEVVMPSQQMPQILDKKLRITTSYGAVVEVPL